MTAQKVRWEVDGKHLYAFVGKVEIGLVHGYTDYAIGYFYLLRKHNTPFESKTVDEAKTIIERLFDDFMRDLLGA